MPLPRRRQLPPAVSKAAIRLVDGPGLAVPLAALVIVALHTEAQSVLPRLLGAPLMPPLFVFELVTVKSFHSLKWLFRPLIRATCLVSLA
jgi:hypothetical protein